MMRGVDEQVKPSLEARIFYSSEHRGKEIIPGDLRQQQADRIGLSVREVLSSCLGHVLELTDGSLDACVRIGADLRSLINHTADGSDRNPGQLSNVPNSN